MEPCQSPRVPTEDMRQRIRAILDHLLDQLDAIDAERDEKRKAAIEASGLPVDFVESVLGNQGLSRPVQSATIRNMPPLISATNRKNDRPTRKNGRDSAVYNDPDGLAKELGLADAEKLAKELGQSEATGRSWRLRGYVPSRLNQKVEALKLLRLDRKR